MFKLRHENLKKEEEKKVFFNGQHH